MTNQDELDAIRQARGTCPICAEDGKTFARQLHGLASHLMKEHTVDQLVYEIAGEAVIAAMDDEEQPKLEEGGIVMGPGGLVGGTGCVIHFESPRGSEMEEFAMRMLQALKRQGRLI